MIIAGFGSGAVSASPSLEYKVKAALLFNFLRYTGWPSDSPDFEDSPMVICIFGSDPFGKSIDAMVRDRKAHGRSVEVRRFIEADGGGQKCHLAYLAPSEEKREKHFLRQARGAHLLTVGETDYFLERGGMIRMVLIEGKVRFEVNVDAAGQAGLRLSSRMLTVARRVQSKEGGG